MATFFGDVPKNRQCKGGVTTKEDEIISSRSDEHNHTPNEAEIVASMAVEKMKQQVQEKIDPVPATYQQQLRELSTREDLDQVAANLPTLPSLKSSLYRLRALELIKQKSEDLGYMLAPVEVQTDFELAIIQAVELTFPTTEVKGCFFHFAQALNGTEL